MTEMVKYVDRIELTNAPLSVEQPRHTVETDGGPFTIAVGGSQQKKKRRLNTAVGLMQFETWNFDQYSHVLGFGCILFPLG